MKIGIMQPYFLPYIGYWQLINAVDKYVIYDDVNYIKNSWIHRNKLLLGGKEFLFNLIPFGTSSNKLICEIAVIENQSKLMKTIESAYKKAPFFDKVFPLVKSIIEYENKNLAKFIGNSIIKIATYLEFNTVFIYSSELQKNSLLRSQEKVIHICLNLQGTEYYNAIGGIELYNKADFDANNIKLQFVKTKRIEYKQFNNQFVPNLSILDIMMFNDKENIGIFLKEYELI